MSLKKHGVHGVARMYALIDGNSFYCSCEQVFRPALKDKAVVVLSNNDGCVVSRTAQAKALGIKMGVPYFQVKHLVSQGSLFAFSSNYELYGDMSNRMMKTIEGMVPAVEIYSIDECFAQLSGIKDLQGLGTQIKQRVMQWVGIPTCVGIAPTKTLAKFCNHLAKKHPKHFGGVVVWTDWSFDVQQRALKSEPVGEIWGIGNKIAAKLATLNIHSAWDFVQADESFIRHHFNITVAKTHLEMKGLSCLALEEAQSRRHIVRSRSFGKLVGDLQALQSAVTHHVKSGVQALRKERSKAHTISVFIHTDRFGQDEQYSGLKTIGLPHANDDVIRLHQAAQELLKQIYKPQYRYKKCGVMLGGLSQGPFEQSLLLDEASDDDRLMTAWDGVMTRFGKNSITLGTGLLNKDWQMRRDHLSPCFTTDIDGLLVVG